MVAASLGLAVFALLAGWVSPGEVPALLDRRLLSLFVVLILAVECARESALFDLLVRAVLGRIRTARSLAAASVLMTGAMSAVVTNDVALLLVVPFTLGFGRAAPGLELREIVILQISAANLLGSLTPTGNPQNLFLYLRGGFTPRSFLEAQLPWVACMTLLTLMVVPLLVSERVLPTVHGPSPTVDPDRAATFVGLLVLAVLAVFRLVPDWLPLAASLAAVWLLRRRLARIDFSLVVVFAALFVGVAGLRRSALAGLLDPIPLVGSSPQGFVLAGALLSQLVSNVPAALLLAPHADPMGPLAWVGLLYGVNAGGCGTPISSLANLIGARIYLKERREPARFWSLFLAVSAALLAAGTLVSCLLVGGAPGSRGHA